MAQRRMISKEIHQDGRFMTLSPTNKILYDDLVLYADDDGFCNDTDLINLMDKATDENYKELEKAGLLAKVEDHYLIVDWLTTQILNHYSRSSLLDLSSKVFIKLDFKYTVDPQDKNIAISLDDWIEKKNRDRTINLKALQRQRLKEVVTQMVPSGNPNVTQMVPKGSPSIGKYSIDKSSIEQVSTDQDQQRAVKATNYKYINSGSKGGMGETLTTTTPTSTMYNNATTESGEDSGVKDGSTTDIKHFSPLTENRQSDIKDTKDLFNHLTTVFKIKNIPNDHERITTLLDDLSNKYKLEYIANAIELMATDFQGLKKPLPYATVENMLVSHLSDKIKEVTTGDDR